MIKPNLMNKDDGATLVEFALVAPLFVLVLFASFQIGFVMLIQNALDAAVREASRVGITGAREANLSREQAINATVQNVVRKYTGGFVDPSRLNVIVKSYPSLDSIGDPEPFSDTNNNGVRDGNEPFTDINNNNVWDVDQGISGSFGLSGQVVQYEINYEWDTIFPIFGRSSKIVLRGITPVVNEEY